MGVATIERGERAHPRQRPRFFNGAPIVKFTNLML